MVETFHEQKSVYSKIHFLCQTKSAALHSPYYVNDLTFAKHLENKRGGIIVAVGTIILTFEFLDLVIENLNHNSEAICMQSVRIHSRFLSSITRISVAQALVSAILHIFLFQFPQPSVLRR